MIELPLNFKCTSDALLQILDDFVERGLPHRRVARLVGLLILANTTIPADLSRRVADYLLRWRRSDGGWVDCEDTSWCYFFLNSMNENVSIEATITWLSNERVDDGWGYCQRDQPCIPITATVRLLVPPLSDHRSAAWLEEAWCRELAGPHVLSYKAAWYLLARDDDPDDTLENRTIQHLIIDQREDGTWGPWKNHPAPNCCFSTGIAMWALGRRGKGSDVMKCLRGAVSWCENNSLPDGLFPTHYIEEGTAWLLAGWAAALSRLSR